MSYELAIIALGILTLAVLGVEIMYTYMSQGFRYGFSANRPAVEVTPFGQRLKNSYQNQIECVAYGLPILTTAALLLNSEPLGQAAQPLCS